MTKKKNIFIAGIARSGKSTLSKRLNKNKDYNYIPLDYLVSSLKHNFPETQITSKVVIDKISSKKLALLLSRFMMALPSSGEIFILDSAHILPEDLNEIIDREKWDIYYFGYPNISLEEKFTQIRKYEKEKDWTRKRDDEELLRMVKDLIDLSKKVENTCHELDIPFIDTSYGIEEAINKIIEARG